MSDEELSTPDFLRDLAEVQRLEQEAEMWERSAKEHMGECTALQRKVQALEATIEQLTPRTAATPTSPIVISDAAMASDIMALMQRVTELEAEYRLLKIEVQRLRGALAPLLDYLQPDTPVQLVADAGAALTPSEGDE